MTQTRPCPDSDLTRPSSVGLTGFTAIALGGIAVALLPIGYLHLDAGGLLDPTRYLISDYAAAPGGRTLLALSMSGLIVAGVAMIVALGGLPGSGPVRVWLASWCTALAVAAAFPTNDPGAGVTTSALVHRYAAGWLLASLPVAGWLLARSCSRLPELQAIGGQLRLLSVLCGATGLALLVGHVVASSPRVEGLGLLQRALLVLEVGLLLAGAAALRRAVEPAGAVPFPSHHDDRRAS